MENIESARDGSLLILTLARGKANALNQAMLDELYAAAGAAETDDGVRGLVLASNRPRFFSSGFDVREVFAYDRSQMAEFFGRFIDVYERLARFPKPAVAALTGHTFAGGAILACTCDFRIMAEGDYGFALNEINLGLALSAGLRRIIVNAAGLAGARELLLLGEPISPARACEIGLVRELAPPEKVTERAIALARALAAKPPQAFREIKRSVREAFGPEGPGDRGILLGPFLDMWFSEEARQARAAVVARLQSVTG